MLGPRPGRLPPPRAGSVFQACCVLGTVVLLLGSSRARCPWASMGRWTYFLIMVRLEGKVTAWLMVHVPLQLGKGSFLRGLLPAPASPCPGACSAPTPGQRVSPLGALTCLPPKPAAPLVAQSSQAPALCRAPPGSLGPLKRLESSEGAGGGGGGAETKQNKQNSPPSQPPPAPSPYLCLRSLLQSLAQCRVEKCDGADSRPGAEQSRAVGQVWFLPRVEGSLPVGESWPEFTAVGAGAAASRLLTLLLAVPGKQGPCTELGPTSAPLT